MGILGWLSKLGSRNEKPVGRGKYYEMGGGWGNDIDFTNYVPGRNVQDIVGHKQDIPQVGDFVVSPMSSGKRCAFRVTEVKWCCDPPDMFFAVVVADHCTDWKEKPNPFDIGVLTNS